jgi:glutamyl-tRNA synthetase
VSKSGAKFNPDKTKWFNQNYLQKKTNKELATLFEPILIEKGINSNTNYIEKVVSLIKERATFVQDFWSLSDFFFVAPIEYDTKAVKKQWKESTPDLMKELINVIEEISDFNSETIENNIKEWITSKEIGFGKVMQPFRLSLVGALKGPHLFDIAEMIGKPETIARIKKAINTL